MDSKQNIFRTEVIENQRAKWVGRALLIKGVPVWLYVLFCAFFISIFIVFLLGVTYSRRINVYGEVTTSPRSINVFSPQQGFIAEHFVSVGDLVSKGQPLYKIDVSRVTDIGKVSTNTRSALEQQLKNIDSIITKLLDNKKITLENLISQKKQYEQAHIQSKLILDSAREGVDFAWENKSSYEEYKKRGLVTKEQLNVQTYSFYQQQSLFQNLQSQYIQESLQISNLESEIAIRSADFDNQISQHQSQRSELYSKLSEASASDMLLINAPSDGRIESLSVTLGQMVNNGDSLVQINPSKDTIFQLVLWIPNSSLPYLKEGDFVNIRYDAFPYQKFGQFSGRIESIAYTPASTQEMSTYTSSPIYQSVKQSASYYKVMIAIEKTHIEYQGKSLPLTNGMKVQSTLFLEKRPLYQWMISPFYDIKKSLAEPINE